MIRIRLFAMLGEAAGADAVELPPPPDGRVATLAGMMARKFPAVGKALGARKVLVVVNGRYASMASPVADGDEVAFLPPVSGG